MELVERLEVVLVEDRTCCGLVVHEDVLIPLIPDRCRSQVEWSVDRCWRCRPSLSFLSSLLDLLLLHDTCKETVCSILDVVQKSWWR